MSKIKKIFSILGKVAKAYKGGTTTMSERYYKYAYRMY